MSRRLKGLEDPAVTPIYPASSARLKAPSAGTSSEEAFLSHCSGLHPEGLA